MYVYSMSQTEHSLCMLTKKLIYYLILFQQMQPLLASYWIYSFTISLSLSLIYIYY